MICNISNGEYKVQDTPTLVPQHETLRGKSTNDVGSTQEYRAKIYIEYGVLI